MLSANGHFSNRVLEKGRVPRAPTRGFLFFKFEPWIVINTNNSPTFGDQK